MVIGAKLRWLGVEKDVRLADGNLTDMSSLIRILRDVKPDEIYNLAAQSFVKSSWNQPVLTGNVTDFVRPTCWKPCASKRGGALLSSVILRMYGLCASRCNRRRRLFIRARPTLSRSSMLTG